MSGNVAMETKMYRYNAEESGITGSGLRGRLAGRKWSAGALLASLFDALGAWSDRRRQRFSLARLDDRMLRDIGLTVSDVEAEITKPFWR